jgi:MtN3 and saliva related transmembrane protein
MDAIAALGLIAGCTTVVSFLPQVLQAWRTRRTRDLSFRAFALLGLGAALWLTYGVLTRDLPIVITNISVGLMVSAILVAKVRFDGSGV